MHNGHCAALDVRATADGAKEFFCTIYERRPEICRDLGCGWAECEAEVDLKGGRK
jgi:Fe-S-cluster containining protein